ncbi:ABC transporter ATP-binding protein [Streptantibioticus silvisoli]|uniref:ATP-binding cassette domain-containing protein n=1 Tax=Streptantibioticus silvisoli TaxID=2705255 RepID=A0ABT6W6L0_9ACTN|nr:ATP-binding cassette domain-containing protein [Streptantibioticus silvisoli]MDI5965283.1 ATP-binding cassette domain-containing protein [Streptantibioticus silvisoli]
MVAPPDNDMVWGDSLHHAHQGSPALLGVTLGARAGEILGVTGPHGAGKTTLLRCLSGQLVPDAGEVWFDGAPVHSLAPGARERLRRDRFGWIGPVPRLVPELTARENAALPLLLAGAGHRAASRAAHEWLERLDVGDLAGARPQGLTQAQRQRVAIARALAVVPQVLFADEPTAPLHTADRVQVLRTLTTAARSHGITVLLATGDAEAAAAHADRVVNLLDGRTATAGLPALPAGPVAQDVTC